MNTLILQAIKKSRTSLSVLVLIALAGFYALNYLPKATEPDVNFPGAFVGVFFEGVSPEDSERLLAKPFSLKEFLLKTQKDYWLSPLKMH